MSELDAIKEKLEGTFDLPVYYGMAANHPRTAPWNYIVFSRNRLRRDENRTSYVQGYSVAIVRENYLYDFDALDVIAAMESLPGIRLVNGDVEFVYDLHNTTVVEMCILRFARGVKA